ncbi:MAG: bifunctional 5,10-methylene-tetrahydrofolate dehydrogenase/5,10-methylene-tetrahydrofolate cyclohydrolase [Lachnospiraceae bacterium]|nr:bifunctional 5,10-methylene-tetrahydrofolate dehydrogenase/5,10-methylene-tetrahydrofolate cyclohydrolase [Lachnospiraceae bacterium]
MATILSGKAVADAISAKVTEDVIMLKEQGVSPCLAIVRVGENPSDLSYERGAVKRCELTGVEYKKYELPADISEEDLLKVIEEVNNDAGIHGVLLFRPLPKHIDSKKVENALLPEKDVDCMTEGSLSGIFTGSNTGYPACTPQSCIEILDYYGIDITGKNVVVIGRSLVVGKPVSMMLLARNATVTICHTKTKNMSDISKNADIIIAAAGKAGVVTKDYVSAGQTVIDVGINVNDEGKLVGDVAYDEVAEIVDAITPVPGGVGSVTTSVLISHVVDAAKKTVK